MKNGREIYCDYCGNRTEYVDSAVIYGKSYGMTSIWQSSGMLPTL